MLFDKISSSLQSDIRNIITTLDSIRLSQSGMVALIQHRKNGHDSSASPLADKLNLNHPINGHSNPLYLALETMSANPLSNQLDNMKFLAELRKIALGIIIDELHHLHFAEKEKNENIFLLEQDLLAKINDKQANEKWASYLQQIKQNEERAIQFMMMMATMDALRHEYLLLDKEIKALRSELRKDIQELTGQLTGPDGMPVPSETQNKIADRFQAESEKIYKELRDEKLNNIHLTNNREQPKGTLILSKKPEKDIAQMVIDDPRFKVRLDSSFAKIAGEELLNDKIYNNSQIASLQDSITKILAANPDIHKTIAVKNEEIIQKVERKNAIQQEHTNIKTNVIEKFKDVTIDINIDEDDFFNDTEFLPERDSIRPSK